MGFPRFRVAPQLSSLAPRCPFTGVHSCTRRTVTCPCTLLHAPCSSRRNMTMNSAVPGQFSQSLSFALSRLRPRTTTSPGGGHAATATPSRRWTCLGEARRSARPPVAAATSPRTDLRLTHRSPKGGQPDQPNHPSAPHVHTSDGRSGWPHLEPAGLPPRPSMGARPLPRPHGRRPGVAASAAAGLPASGSADSTSPLRPPTWGTATTGIGPRTTSSSTPIQTIPAGTSLTIRG